MLKSANVISFLPSAINRCLLSYVIFSKVLLYVRVIWQAEDAWLFELSLFPKMYLKVEGNSGTNNFELYSRLYE